VYVDNMQIFRQKFSAVPELQAFKVTYRTPFSARDFVQIIEVRYRFMSVTNDGRTMKLSGITVLALFKHLST